MLTILTSNISSLSLDDKTYNTIKDIITPDMKVLNIPFASDLQWQLNGDFTDHINNHYRAFEPFGITRENFYVVKPLDTAATLIRRISEADIIYFSGGFMENAVFVSYATGIDQYINCIKDKKIFIGESAGSLILSKHYYETPYVEEAYKKYDKKLGLNLIDLELPLLVHFNKDNSLHYQNLEQLKSLSNNKDNLVLTDNSLALVYPNNSIELFGEAFID